MAREGTQLDSIADLAFLIFYARRIVGLPAARPPASSAAKDRTGQTRARPRRERVPVFPERGQIGSNGSCRRTPGVVDGEDRRPFPPSPGPLLDRLPFPSTVRRAVCSGVQTPAGEPWHRTRQVAMAAAARISSEFR